MRRLIGAIERNGFEFGMRPESFEPLIKRLEPIANRIVLGILEAGFFFALALGIYLTWSILRSGRD